MGGELNAATSRETTVVYTRVPDGRIEQALDAMTDMVFARVRRRRLEREVVLEEIAMVDDNPQDLVHDLAAEAVFGSHPLGRPVIERGRDLGRVAARAARLPRRRLCRPERRARRLGARLARPTRRAVRRPQRRLERRLAASPLAARPATQARYRFLRRRTEQYHVVLAGPGIARDDDRRYAFSLLDAILGGSASSRLFQEIREKRGMAYSVYTYGSRTPRRVRSGSTSAPARTTSWNASP